MELDFISKIFIVIAGILLLIVQHYWYQLKRNNAVYSIRRKWIDTDDKRRYMYSYDYMLNPAKHNLYGLKYPRDKNFK
jgi:hypothetical protein